jgi:3-oxoacyl-[acyl-carrier-protein] synthase II
VRNVVVSGTGVISPLGNDVEAFTSSLRAGRGAVRRLEGRFAERMKGHVGAPVAFDPTGLFPAAKLRMLDPVSRFALAAAKQAVGDAALDFGAIDRRRVGVFVGTGMGGAEATDDAYFTLYGEGSDRLQPFTVLTAMANAPAAWIGLEYALAGPNLTYSTACSSSAVAIGEAARRIEAGEIDIAIAGGAEAPLNFGTIKAWDALKTLALEDRSDPAASCKPFAKDRTGLVLGEGAAMVVLEREEHRSARGGRAHAHLVGYGLCTDAGHITRPSVEGQRRAMGLALGDAGRDGDAIDYINAHGTGTLANDGVETAAIKQVFGKLAHEIPVSSTKAMHGHLLGGAGALELVAAIVALAGGFAPPTINLRVPDPECDLDYVPLTARPLTRARAAMSSSFAFGGTNAVLVVTRD